MSMTVIMKPLSLLALRRSSGLCRQGAQDYRKNCSYGRDIGSSFTCSRSSDRFSKSTSSAAACVPPPFSRKTRDQRTKPLRANFPVRAGGSTDKSGSGRGGTGNSVNQELLILTGEILSMAYPLWIALACLLGLWRPSTFLWVDQKWQITGLSLAMLGMGMTLTLDDLRDAMLMSKELLIGFVLQYTVMPFSGFLVSKLLKLPSHFAAGLILVGCCPGGTASNIITYLARGNVALSVLMTTASTISAVVMTPFLTSKLAGQFVAVDPIGLFISTAQVVLAPVLLGATINQYFNAFVKLVSPLMPLVAVATSATLCGSVIAQNAPAILSSGFQVVLASCSLHASGFFFGYTLSRMLGLSVPTSRTISIEVGMQNSVLGLVLASRHFGDPLTTVPSAVSSLCHLIYGSVLVGVWRYLETSIHVED